MTDELLQAQLLVLAGVPPLAELKGALQRNIGEFYEDSCVSFKCDPHLLPVAAVCRRFAADLHLVCWSEHQGLCGIFHDCLSTLIHLWQLPLQSCSAFSPPYKAF